MYIPFAVAELISQRTQMAFNPQLGSQSNCLIIKGIVGKQAGIRWYVGFLNFRTYKLLQKVVQKNPSMF